ncbi:MAG: hypothetical protein K2Q12_10605, partial [Rickettsiales bacterium]|nr:hypothetical protein [Rickettsiales bacterium]
REKVIEAVAHAVVSFHRATAPWVAGRCSVAEFWQIGLKQTYASEFRAERHGRQDMLVEAMHTALMARSRALLEHHSLQGLTLEGEQMLSMLSPTQKKRQRLAQKGRNLISKAQHLLRLAKAAFTFVGGLDYLVYKIERHSGVRLEPTAFQRRHPLLGIGPLFVRGLRARAFR